MCQEGCQCDDGFLFDGGECKTLQDCGCNVNGKFYKVRNHSSFFFAVVKHHTSHRKKLQLVVSNFFCSQVRRSSEESVKRNASAKQECSPVNP